MRISIFTIFLISSIFFNTVWVIAQDHGAYEFTESRLNADQLYDKFAYKKAIAAYERLIKREKDESEKLDMMIRIADCYDKMNKPRESTKYYKKITDAYETSGNVKFRYAKALYRLAKYDKAKYWLEQAHVDLEDDEEVKKLLSSFDNLDYFYQDSSLYFIDPVKFNTEKYSDFSPAFDKDGIIFVSNRFSGNTSGLKKYQWDGSLFLDLYKVEYAEDGTIKNDPDKYHKYINSEYHEGPLVMYDNYSKMFVTRNNFHKKKKLIKNEEGVSTLQLYFTQKDEKNKWIKPVEFPYNSHEYSTGHPAITSDGKTLYFVSDNPETTLGKADIYKSVWLDSMWSEPQNLGSHINTNGKEMFPFLYNDSVLVFASDGHNGLGGLDLFSIRLYESEATPVNFGRPINTHYDDFGMIVEPNGRRGYLSSNRDSEDGKDNIYRYEQQFIRMRCKVIDKKTRLPLVNATVKLAPDGKVARTDEEGYASFIVNWDNEYLLEASKQEYSKDEKVFNTKGIELIGKVPEVVLELEKDGLFVEGFVYDMEDSVRKVARIILKNENTGDTIKMFSTVDAKYRLPVKPNELYTVFVDLPRYFAHRYSFETGSEASGVIEEDFGVEKIVIGKSIRLDNIYYDLDKHFIREDAAKELDKLYATLLDNPTIIIELGSHTDSRGSDSYNLRLSQRRAKSAVEYIVHKGIGETRIMSHGYGETKLVNECANGVDCSKEQHQENRRTEFMVTGFLPFEDEFGEDYKYFIDPSQITEEAVAALGEDLVDEEGKVMGSLTISGILYEKEDMHEHPAEDVLIKIYDAQGQMVFKVNTNSDGIFNAMLKESPLYQIQIVKKGYEKVYERVDYKKFKERSYDFMKTLNPVNNKENP